jgi:hypothetical protein
VPWRYGRRAVCQRQTTVIGGDAGSRISRGDMAQGLEKPAAEVPYTVVRLPELLVKRVPVHKLRLAPIEYHVGDVWVEVSPNPQFGMATIWDADILLWASTQITESLDRGLPASRTLKFHPHNLLKSIRRDIGGDHYVRLRAALERLTRGGEDQHPVKRQKEIRFLPLARRLDGNHRGGHRRTAGNDDHDPGLVIPWIVMKGGVLTIHEDNFLLTDGIERWLYRVARKHAGQVGCSRCGNCMKSRDRPPASRISRGMCGRLSRRIACGNTS